MLIKSSETNVKQIEMTLKKLSDRLPDVKVPITGWQIRLVEYVNPEHYEVIEDWKPISAGEKWPVDRKITAIFSTYVEIPQELRDKNLYLDINVGGESLLRIDGKAYHGLDRNRSMIPLGETVKQQKKKLNLQIESAVDRQNYEFQFRYWGTNVAYKEHQFKHARFVAINESVWNYYFDLLTAKECYLSISDEQLEERYFSIIKESMAEIQFDGGREKFLASLKKAGEIFAERLPEDSVKTSPMVIHVTGHSHIDVAYLWTIRETVRKCSRTFSTAVRLMDLYPKYHFIQSQPLLYYFAKRYYPEVYKRMKEKVGTGQWETEGAMWVEPDCNIPSGESLIRQIMIGKKFFKDEFGYCCKVLWLPDTFGFTWTLPQIMKGCGLDYFATQKLIMNQVNEFPYDLFTWRGPDGSEVLALFTGDYNGELTGREIREKIESFKNDDPHTEYPLLYGFGDGGGGVTFEMLEKAKRLEKFSKSAHFENSSIKELFGKLEKSKNLPVWADELYLEAHRGVYTSHAELKRLNRRCESLLRDAEFFLAVSPLNRDTFASTLDEAWKLVLTNQFHDIIAGSTIQDAFNDAVQSYKEALEKITSLKEKARNSLMEDTREGGRSSGDHKSFTVWNTLGWDRNDIVILPLNPGTYQVLDENGSEVPSQVVGGKDGRLAFAAELPSMGYRTYQLIPVGEEKPRKKNAGPDCRIEEYMLENRYFRITFGPSGNIAGFRDKRNGREVIPAGKEANEFQVFVDEPLQYDAWEVRELDGCKCFADFSLQEFCVLEDGPLIKRIRIKKSWNHTHITQNIVLYDTMPRIDFQTEVDWQEDRKLLKVAFPVDVVAKEATYDIAYGTIRRPTHNNTSWDRAKFEVPAQMWADLSEHDYGVSLLNDSKYGYDIKDGTMRLTLLKSPINPNPEADRGINRFTYSLVPHIGEWQEGETARRACELNAPLTVFSGRVVRGESSGSFFDTDCGNVFIEAVKPSEDGNGIIIRLLEKYGECSDARIRCAFPLQKVYRCNMLEENEEELPCEKESFVARMKPYKIETFRLIEAEK